MTNEQYDELEYRKYLNEDGEIDEQLVEEELRVQIEDAIEDEIAERLEHQLECEAETIRENLLPGEDYESELEARRDELEQEIRLDVEEEFDTHPLIFREKPTLTGQYPDVYEDQKQGKACQKEGRDPR